MADNTNATIIAALIEANKALMEELRALRKERDEFQRSILLRLKSMEDKLDEQGKVTTSMKVCLQMMSASTSVFSFLGILETNSQQQGDEPLHPRQWRRSIRSAPRT